MKKLLLFVFVLSLACKEDKPSYVVEINQFRYEQNTYFANPESSPLTEEDVKTFTALDFFEIDEKYKVRAAFERTPDSPIFEMPTTTERLPLYRKYGIARFELNGKQLELSLYQNQQNMDHPEYGNLLFLPFNDATNGTTSYGGGRFIDIEIPEENSETIEIDFNKAYNPYCAYNYKYSCPIPPVENQLEVAINAGVKAYEKAH